MHNPLYTTSSPFKKVSYSAGIVSSQVFKDIEDTFTQPNWMMHVQNCNIDIKTEIPYYQDRISIGCDITRFSIAFGIIESYSVVGTLKFRQPIKIPLGHVALTFTPKLGGIRGVFMKEFVGIGIVGGLQSDSTIT